MIIPITSDFLVNPLHFPYVYNVLSAKKTARQKYLGEKMTKCSLSKVQT